MQVLRVRVGKQSPDSEEVPELYEKALLVILPRTGRGSQYVRALRAAMLELIDANGLSKTELEKTICLDWNIMSRSFDHHFNDMIQFGLVAGDAKGLSLTAWGKKYLDGVLSDESVEQVRARPKSAGGNPD